MTAAAAPLSHVDRPWPQTAKDAGILNAADLVRRLRQTSKALEPLVSRIAPALSVEDAIDVHAALEELGAAAWRSRCLVIGEVWFRFDEPHDARARDIGNLFGLSRSAVYNILAVWRTFGDSILEGEETRQAVYLAAARTSDPQAWIERAAGLSKRQLAAAIAAEEKGVSGETPQVDEDLQPRCPACGQALPGDVARRA